MQSLAFLPSLLLLTSIPLALSQLTGPVGPLTSYSDKAAAKTCDITDYGAVADGTTDVGPAIQDAMNDCKYGGLVYVPPGNYSLSTFPALTSCTAFAFQLDGVLARPDDYIGGHDYMLGFRGCTDFEFFSGNSEGTVQGYGYKFIENGTYGPRMFNFQDMANFSIHGFAAVDSPSYYFRIDSGQSGEIYNLIVRGISDVGATDAFDVWGDNIWLHDIEVTNGDECVTLKSGATNMLIQSIYCNLSGGTAIGSLGTGTLVENVLYERLYMNRADACFIKTNNGNGTVRNIVWDTVIVHWGAYPLTIDAAWGSDLGQEGVEIYNLTFRNWHGQNADSSRPVIRLQCDPDVPCYEITLENVALWTASNDEVEWLCENAYGSGACLGSTATEDLAATTSIVTTGKPYYATSYMSVDLATGFPTNSSFAIPAVPTSFYPGATPSSKLLSLTAAGGL